MKSEFSIEILSKYIEQHTLQCAYCTSCFHDSLIEMIITECIFQNLYRKYVHSRYVYSYTELARGLQRAITANAVPQHIIEEIIELEIANL